MPGCIEKDCNRCPIYNYITEKKGLYCIDHKLDNMKNIVNKKCLEENCNRSPGFNLPNEKNKLYCAEHKKIGMVDKKHPKCIFENCKEYAGFNYKNEKTPKYCSKHRLLDMISAKHKCCEFGDCIKRASFNYSKIKTPKFCGDHKENNMSDVRHKKCTSCNLFRVVKINNYLCAYCNPIKSNRFRTKENEIKKLLENNNINFINNKSFNNECCLKYRPDFLIELPRFFLIVEVDEFAHKQYEQECEIIRMNNIASGLGLPVKFVRYNPDNKEISKKVREEVLIKTVKEIMNNEFYEDFDVKYLFY